MLYGLGMNPAHSLSFFINAVVVHRTYNIRDVQI